MARTRILAMLLSAVFLSSFFPSKAIAGASLYLFPPSGTYRVSENFTVYVKIDSAGQDINAAEGTLVFNPGEMEVVSASKTGSFFTLWTADPSFSNNTGKIEFGGGTQKAYAGSGGTVFAIVFRGKIASTAQINFSSGSVLAADGMGNNVLSGMHGGSYSFIAKIAPPKIETPTETPPVAQNQNAETQAEIKTPAAPRISSPSHPDPEKWHKSRDIVFLWDLPKDITAIRGSFNNESIFMPQTAYTAETIKKTFPNCGDGVWYFHLQFKNKYGWGSIAHYRVMIDGSPPAPFEIDLSNHEQPEDPTPVFHFKAQDDHSGIFAYEIKIDNRPAILRSPAIIEASPHQSDPLSPGDHLVVVKAIDGAGNSTLSMAEFAIPAMNCPVITQVPQNADESKKLVFRGNSSYPKAGISAAIEKNGQKLISKSALTDENGDWIVSFGNDIALKEGIYQAVFKIYNEHGGQSAGCALVNFEIKKTAAAKIGEWLLTYCSMIFLLILLILAVIILFAWIWRKVMLWRDRIKRETDEADLAAMEAFEALKRHNRREIDYLERLPEATEREKQIRQRLQNALDDAEGQHSQRNQRY